MSVTEEDLVHWLDDFTITASDNIVQKMLGLCNVYHLSAEDFVSSWVAYSVKKGDMQPTIALLEKMEKEEFLKPVSKPSKQQKTSASPSLYNSKTINLINNDSFDKGNKSQPSTNRTSNYFSPTSMSPASFTPSRKYNSRTGAGETVCFFGETENIEWKHSDEYSCTIKAFSENTLLRDCYNYMSEKLRDCASILNDMIQQAAHHFQMKNEIQEWGCIQLPSVETVPVVGRICSDSSGKLNVASLLLEGSQELCSGQIVPLDVSHMESFSFFPGQIIAGNGINNLGKKFVINNLFENILPPSSKKAPDLENCIDSLSIVISAGPYTTSDSLSFEPLQDLLKYVKAHSPHVVILIGPFVDEKNEIIENGAMPETYEELFDKVISDIIGCIELLSTKVILVPSTRDVHHDFIYPTPPYRVKHSTKRLHLASDPCILDIEGVLIGITSTDILFHLGKEEIAQQQMPDRLGRLCRHLLTQQNFYPLYPPNEEVNIDYLHYELHAGIPVMPHLLIVPSDFRYFIKDINDCCFINPERLTKRTTGGTFARLKVKPVDKEKYLGSIIDSLQVEILKI